MRKGLILFSLMIYIVDVQGQGRNSPPPVMYTTPVSANRDFMRERGFKFSENEHYIIDGRKVMGTPFLYREWNKGIVVTASGRTFDRYLLRYNAYHQTVFFLNGSDSLEVDEEIKEFSLTVKQSDSTKTFKFLNGKQFKGNKDRSTVYYELLIDDEKGQLLKVNRKLIIDGRKSLAANGALKIFELENTYYYFDKKSEKILRIKSNGSNMDLLPELDEQQKNGLKTNGLDTSQEESVLEFFKKYFEKKGF